MIKNIVFDLGGVIITLNFEQAVRRFYDMGVDNIRTYLDPFAQTGIFGDLESGKITAEDFRLKLSELAGCELSFADCLHAWKGFVEEIPRCNLDTLVALRQKGYRLILLSNTNPYMMSWAMSPDFSGDGHALSRCHLDVGSDFSLHVFGFLLCLGHNAIGFSLRFFDDSVGFGFGLGYQVFAFLFSF